VSADPKRKVQGGPGQVLVDRRGEVDELLGTMRVAILDSEIPALLEHFFVCCVYLCRVAMHIVAVCSRQVLLGVEIHL
jgi:hypothetical protein